MVLEDFGFGKSMGDWEDQEAEEFDGMGAGQLPNSLDHSDLRQEIKKAIKSVDECALSSAIDVARELGSEYPFKKELDAAEGVLFDMLQVPEDAFAKTD